MSCPVHAPEAVKACARCGTFFCGGCVGTALCATCAPSADQQATGTRRRQAVSRTVRIALLLAAFLYAMPGVVSWALTLRQGENSLDLLLFSGAFSAGPLVAAGLLRIFQRPWLVSFALPTTALALLLCAVLEFGGLTKAFVLASALVGLAVGRTLLGTLER